MCLNFDKIRILKGWNVQVKFAILIIFDNWEQFTKSCFCCLLSVFGSIHAIKWFYRIWPFWSNQSAKRGHTPWDDNLGILKIVVVCLFDRGKLFESMYSRFCGVEWSPWRVPLELFQIIFQNFNFGRVGGHFLKIGVGQFMKSCFCCLLPFFGLILP